MSCNNCFNGCTEIISDKCIKYTGIDIPSLGINKNDSLLVVNTKLTEYILKLMDGTGIVPNINSNSLCSLISSFLPLVGNITIVDIIDTIFKSLCSLQTQVTDINNSVDSINTSYTIGCLTGVTLNSKTHDILQATIDKLCALNSSYGLFTDVVANTYVRITNDGLHLGINDYIESYLLDTSISGSTVLVKSKMIPYVAMEYYGSLINFDVTGAGTGDWVDVYLCNGNNNTPDKRGRVAVGTTIGMGGSVFPAQTDPSIPGNPNYSLNSAEGNNQVILNETQIPPHLHNNTVNSTVIDGSHNHNITRPWASDNTGAGLYSGTYGGGVNGITDKSSSDNSNITVNTTITNASKGGGLAHTNIQPSLACHYIIYLP